MPTIVLSDAPSSFPSNFPTIPPTISNEPTSSPYPTITASPTVSDHPSNSPSAKPSVSQVPTISKRPSSAPSMFPTLAPTISAQPSSSPSISSAPSVSFAPSLQPTLSPSNKPTNFPSTPSEPPSSSPTIDPAVMTSIPTLTTTTVKSEKIVMILNGMPELLEGNETAIWENITSNQVIHYHAELGEALPTISPFNITAVTTLLVDQSILQVSDTFHNAIVLKLTYSQEITYGIFDENLILDDNVDDFLFLFPFDSDAYPYKVALISALNIPNWLILESITFGDPPPATAPASSAASLSQTAVRAISASIVLGACVIVAFLLWDRNRKDARYHEESSERGDEPNRRGPNRQDLDTTEFDNAGQPIDWANPFSDTGVAVVRTAGGTLASRGSSADVSTSTAIVPLTGGGSSGGDGAGAGTTGTAATVGTLTTVESVAIPNPSPIPAGRSGPPSNRSLQGTRNVGGSGSLPPLAPTLSSSGGNQLSQGRYTLTSRPFPPPLPAHNQGGFRHTSVTDTDITDLTYSDGGYQSDRGSDAGFPPQLPPISDDSLHGGDIASTPFLSPLHIPDEEAIEMAAGLTPPASPMPSILGLSSDVGSPMYVPYCVPLK